MSLTSQGYRILASHLLALGYYKPLISRLWAMGLTSPGSGLWPHLSRLWVIDLTSPGSGRLASHLQALGYEPHFSGLWDMGL